MIRCRRIRKKLLALCEGELESGCAMAIREHLESCHRCRTEYEKIQRGVLLAQHLSLVPVPQLSWGEFEQMMAEKSDLLEATARPSGSMTVPPRLAVAVTVLSIFALFGYLAIRISHFNSVDLDSYLHKIETSPAETAPQRIASPPSGFSGASEAEALKAAGIEHTATVSPLTGYTLVEHRVLRARAGAVVQLVYGSAKDSFAVFVAPRRLPFFFGKREMERVQLKGIPCDEVSCPRTVTLVFGAGRFHCVLISRSKAQDDLATIVQYFISAHQTGVES